ncbi:MAG: ECF transporter S component [Oscillospiraceae bacterium]|nr:ECF transporter S component [Oscillospiraceae bacterium]
MNTTNASTKNKSVRKLAAAGVCLALCMLLPFLTGQIPQIGAALSPMHIPVFLSGFIAGPFYAAIVGLIAPLLRFALFGMPPIMPIGVAMSFELAVYGFVSGWLYRALPKRTGYIYLSLIGAMFFGRIVWGGARYLLSGVTGLPFTFELFMAGAFINAVPGIILHIVLIPVIVMALKRADFLPTDSKSLSGM